MAHEGVHKGGLRTHGGAYGARRDAQRRGVGERGERAVWPQRREDSRTARTDLNQGNVVPQRCRQEYK